MSHFRELDKHFIVKINQACQDERKFIEYLEQKHGLSRVCRPETSDNSSKLRAIFRVNELWEREREALRVIPRRPEKHSRKFAQYQKRKFAEMDKACRRPSPRPSRPSHRPPRRSSGVRLSQSPTPGVSQRASIGAAIQRKSVNTPIPIQYEMKA